MGRGVLFDVERNEEETIDVVDGALEEDDAVAEQIRYTVTSYGADLPVDAIVSRLDREDIEIPVFQRGFVWSQGQSSRFIESLLLGIPVPGVFLFKDPDNQKLLVVDGQQRLHTLQAFRHGLFESREFSLVGVAEEFQGATYKSLDGMDRRRLDDSIVHATIFQQDEPRADRSSMYTVFERLNTGGTPLQPQEIRACVYQGNLSSLLVELTEGTHWRSLYGPKNKRKKEEEIVLRFLALYYSIDAYRRPMKKFLNNFMESNRNCGPQREAEFRSRFESVASVVDEILGPKALRPDRAFNVSVADATLVGLSRRLDEGSITDSSSLQSAHDSLLEQLRHDSLHVQGTTDEDRLRTRVTLAIEAYKAVP